MAIKRNRWLVSGVLIVAVGAFLAISILPLLAGRNDRSTATPATDQPPAAAADQQAELEARARGFELVLEREPENQMAIQGLVEARIQLGDLEGAIGPLEKLAELNPEVPDYQILLGQSRQRLGNLDGASQAYRTVLTSNPGNINALQALAALLLQQNRPQAAIGLLQDTLQTATQTNEINPGSVDVTSVQLLLGQVYVEDSKPDAALKVYDEALANAGDDFRILAAKALVLREQGQAAEASALFAQAEELAPAQFQDQIRQLAAQPTVTTGEGTPEAADIPASTTESVPASEADIDTPGAAEAEASDVETTEEEGNLVE